MTARHHIDHEARLIITTWEGDAIDEALIEALKLYQKDIQNSPVCIDYDEVVNLCGMSRLKLSLAGLRAIGRIGASTDKYRVKTKLALIVSSDLAFNFARLYITYRNFGKKIKRQVRVFKSEDDACAWIHQINNKNE